MILKIILFSLLLVGQVYPNDEIIEGEDGAIEVELDERKKLDSIGLREIMDHIRRKNDQVTEVSVFEDSIIVKRFLRDVVLVVDAPDVEIKIKSVIAEHPKALGVFIDSERLDKAMTEAGLQGIFSGDMRTKLSALLKDKIHHKINSEIILKFFDPGERYNPAEVATLWVFLSKTQRLIVLDSLKQDAAIKKLAKGVYAQIASFELSNTPAADFLKSGQEGFNLKDEDLKRLFDRLLDSYFDSLGYSNKRQIILDLLALEKEASIGKKLSVLIQNTGPAFQKFCQLVGESIADPIIKEAMQELKTNVRSFDGVIAQKILVERMGGEENYKKIVKSFSINSLAAATIGQAHLAVLNMPDGTTKEVVIKFRRPEIMEHFLREIEVIHAAADSEVARELVSALKEGILAEMDLRLEKDNNKRGQLYSEYSRKVNGESRIRVAKVIEDFGVFEDMIIQEKAPGRPLSSIKETGLVLRSGELLTEFLEAWTKRAFHGDGFYHGDAHSGNIFIEFGLTKDKDFLTTIDYGNVGVLNVEQRRGLIKIMIAAGTKDIEFAVKGISSLASNMTAEKESELREEIRELFSKEGVTFTTRFLGPIGLAMQLKIKLPEGLSSFARGRAFIFTKLAELNTILDKNDPNKKIRRFKIEGTFLKVVGYEILKSLATQTFSRVARNEAILTWEMLRDVVKSNSLKFARYVGNTSGLRRSSQSNVVITPILTGGKCKASIRQVMRMIP